VLDKAKPRKETLSLGWRRTSPARPAAPIDEYVEVKQEAAAARRQADQRRQTSAVAESSIRQRLDNWARWSRGGNYGGADCMTGAICDRLRKAALGLVSSGPEQPLIDVEDALAVNDAWRIQPFRIKNLLLWHYVENKPPAIICRRLRIRLWPARFLSDELQDAEDALKKVLDSRKERNRIPPYNLFPSNNDE
jgi:hypothetical protein